MSTFRPSYKGIGQLLRSEMLQKDMIRRAKNVEALAESTAPDHDPLGVGYKYEFRVMWGEKTSAKGTRRVFARVVNDSDHAVFVEYGGQDTPAHRTLGRALRAAKD